MPSPKTYATAGAFRRALEERLKRASLTDQIDPNRLRRQISFDRILARLFREESAPWVLKGGYALELRFKAARSTVDIDLTVQRVAASASGDQNQIVREMLQSAADVSLRDRPNGPALLSSQAREVLNRLSALAVGSKAQDIKREVRALEQTVC